MVPRAAAFHRLHLESLAIALFGEIQKMAESKEFVPDGEGWRLAEQAIRFALRKKGAEQRLHGQLGRTLGLSDLVQSVFREALEGLDLENAKKTPTFDSRQGFIAWLSVIATRKLDEKSRRAHSQKRDIKLESRFELSDDELAVVQEYDGELNEFVTHFIGQQDKINRVIAEEYFRDITDQNVTQRIQDKIDLSPVRIRARVRDLTQTFARMYLDE